MNSFTRGIRARSFCAAVPFGLAYCALVSTQIASATSFWRHPHTPDVKISVVDHTDGIRVRDRYTGIDDFGLDSLKIHEKYYDDGADSFWSDVEIKVSVRAEDDYPHDPFGGKFFDWDWDWDWGWGWDSKFGRGGKRDWGGWGGWHDDCWDDFYDDCHCDDDEPQDSVFDPNGFRIGIDKFVKNYTDTDWENFSIALGTGLGNDPNDPYAFTPSVDDDGLYFLTDPMAKEMTDYYDPNYMVEGGDEPDAMLWQVGDGYPGQGHGDKAIFWFGVQIPDWMFERDGDYWHAKFTIRQHAESPDSGNELPEPTTVVLGLIGLVGGMVRRGKQALA